jgi:hypothetical protein
MDLTCRTSPVISIAAVGAACGSSEYVRGAAHN